MTQRSWRLVAAVGVVVQVAVLYWPRTPGVGGIPGLDLLVHVVVFALVALAARRAGLPVGPVALALVAHAGLSELVQHTLLDGRSGDWRDALADVVGTAAGLVAGRRARSGRDAVPGA